MKSSSSHSAPPPLQPLRPGDVARTTRDTFRTISMSSVGLEMGIAVMLGLFAGRWADGQLHSAPWLMVVGTALGMAAGMKGVFRAVRESDRLAAQREREQGGAS